MACLISICIPTRNRTRYLRSCVASVLKQDFDGYEVVIVDNGDEDSKVENAAWLRELNHPRIRYLQQAKVVPMTANFEYAVEATQGEYVLCLGDDDGLVANSLGWVATLLQLRRPEVLKSPLVHYFWPGSVAVPKSRLVLPPFRIESSANSLSALKAVLSFKLAYIHLPMIYYGLVSRQVLAKIKKAQGSYFSDAVAVDVYSGMTIALFSENFIIPEEAFCIAGRSAASNGDNFFAETSAPINREFSELSSLDRQYMIAGLPRTASFDVLTALELLRLFRHFPDETAHLRLDRGQMFRSYNGLKGICNTTGSTARAKQNAVLFHYADPDTDWNLYLEPASIGKHLIMPGLLAPNDLDHIVILPAHLKCHDVEAASNLVCSIYRGKTISLNWTVRDAVRKFAKKCYHAVKRFKVTQFLRLPTKK